MATVIVEQPPFRQSPTPPPLTSPIKLDASMRSLPSPVPNKHLPKCPTGPAPALRPSLVTPPASPPSKYPTIQTTSILYPPDDYLKVHDLPPIYVIDAKTLASALDHLATQPLPEAKQVFPWLHGLHPENHVQLSFFIARRRSLRRTPKCVRGITVVKCGGDLTCSKLKGAISPEEILVSSNDEPPALMQVDPKDGFSVRNFQIQTGKMATLSDIVIYGDQYATKERLLMLAKQFSEAQLALKLRSDSLDPVTYNTFIVSTPFSEFERRFPELVAIDSRGQMTDRIMDFFHWERFEMCDMSKASEIAPNIWQGPTPGDFTTDDESFDILIEASDLAQIPSPQLLKQISEESQTSPSRLEFPSSGSIMPPTWSQAEVDGLLDTCRWMYELANPDSVQDSNLPETDQDGDIHMKILSKTPRKLLIHCTDGYTESSLLALTYLMYSEGIPAHEAWLTLHRDKKRNFFAYPSDVALLTSIQPRIMQESPKKRALDLSTISEPGWLSHMDGSLPSRILPYMYLGNLTHANNPELLRELNIRRVLSIGEYVSWPEDEMMRWGKENVLFIRRVQDNGVDPLTEEFDRCLEFIEKGKSDGMATLVHCRVGVSRSATICIAEVMNELGLSFPRAYCFVRARRLNVIIQPHLRFAYELLKWEEYQQQRRGQPLRRELEWATIAREIALMNKPYSRQ
ncbi:MAG: tyrosine/serine/threonine protein phosphatase pps1 [Cirrosporium novae-zelandiae]|nr:MAG: tyrosine/serine/threonine protein phosphatase pps1 [Cirrosporium novae-zelandiae]KAI9735550.1 MAG: tyrosine/serine/threonine protein phosphatase pps1 [Cirrosporium novae-zelandiae]